MKDLDETYLIGLLERYPNGNIHDTVLELKSRLTSLGGETDPAMVAALTEEIRNLATLLEDELREFGRGCEDYINDNEFTVS